MNKIGEYARHGKPSHNIPEKHKGIKAEKEQVFLDDGFGNRCSIICPECGRPTMQIVRPGKFQCAECG